MTRTCERVLDDHREGLDWLQTWWEDEFRQPSEGNPLWENVPLLSHYETWLRRQLARGNKFSLQDGKLVQGGAIRKVGRVVLKLTGNELADARARRMALGLPLKG